MLNNLLIIIFTITAIASTPSFAEAVDKEAIPEIILISLYKKHPNALEVSARPKKHFGLDLYEVFFKEGEDKLIELYRAKGPFYVNAVLIDASGMVPPAAFDSLKAAFGNYEIKEAILVVNPNGPGEEYDFIVNSSGDDWNVSIDSDGKIISKEP